VWGRVDTLVCNAASNPYFGPLADLPDEVFTKIMHNNVLANLWLIRRVTDPACARTDGSIIVVSSIGGLRGDPFLGAYNISKAADMQLVRNLAVELGPANIRVNGIAPGLIKTDFARALWENPTCSPASRRAPRSAASASRTTSPASPPSSPRAAPASSPAR
jgi:NAD(P)-dependent dehydrogenase (short-subunit alcohol dehydrogenase family)